MNSVETLRNLSEGLFFVMPTCLTVSPAVAPGDSGPYRHSHGDPMTVFIQHKMLERLKNVDLEPPISGTARREEILPCLPMPR